jgi:hypothetical protein
MKARAKLWTVYTIVLLVLVSGLFGCGKKGTPTPVPELGPNLLVETQGRVSLKREGWTDYVPVSFGVEVRRGDLLRPDEGQEVKILCADLLLHAVRREGGSPCKVEEPVLRYGESRVLAPRAPGAPIPYILHPRNTAVLDAHPILSWYDTGASSYTVAVVKGGKALWSQSGVQGTELRYPDDAPELEPGVDYLLSVKGEDSGYGSGEDPAKGLGFQVLCEEERAATEARRDEILALPLSDSAHRFALAVYYAGEGLRGEALALLDEISPSISAPAVQLWRGYLLLAMRLPTEAESAYRTALTSAEGMDDLESQAVAYAGLWRVTKSETDFDEAIALYEQLGDEAQIEALRQEKSQ